VTPASLATIVGGAPVELTATLTGSSDPISWTLTGPGSISSTTGVSTIYTPPVDAVGTATVTATAGALTATSTIAVRPPPTRAVVAYAWANAAQAASYTPAPSYAYNAAGGSIKAERSSTGMYSITFEELSLTEGDVQVTAQNVKAKCNVRGVNGSTVEVGCYDSAGNPVDGRYEISVVRAGIHSAASVVGYALVDDPTSASSTPSAESSYNAAGGAITAERVFLGMYRVRFANLTDVRNVQVSAYDSDGFCVFLGLEADAVAVNCYDNAGNAADTRFTVTLIGNDRFSTANVAAYARAHDPASASYTPAAEWSFNSAGGPITTTRSATGTYSIKFAGLDLTRGSVKVSGYDPPHACNVESWAGDTVEVTCHDTTGAPVDSRYSVMVTLDNTPVASRVVAYAWAHEATSAEYEPFVFWRYNATGKPITAKRSGIGDYQMIFTDMKLSSGDVQVTPYASNATCNVANWIGDSVRVRCYDPAGNPVDSKYVVTVWANGRPTAANTVAYAWANDPTSDQYTPDPNHAYNATGGDITVERSATGKYEVRFDGITFVIGAVQVKAVGGSNHCTVEEWELPPLRVYVSCYDSAGAPADSQFTVHAVTQMQSSSAYALGYAWADKSTEATYEPEPSYAYNASGMPITATRTAVGTYSVQLGGQSLARGNLLVSGYGSNARCNLFSWSGDSAQVRCYDANGQPTDSQYTILFTE